MTNLKKCFLVAAIASMTFPIVSCEGTYVVTSRPVHPFYERPIAPGPGYIWIEGDWVFEGGNCVWHRGYWGRPRGERIWHEGHWQQNRKGWHWRRGRWH